MLWLQITVGSVAINLTVVIIVIIGMIIILVLSLHVSTVTTVAAGVVLTLQCVCSTHHLYELSHLRNIFVQNTNLNIF